MMSHEVELEQEREPQAELQAARWYANAAASARILALIALSALAAFAAGLSALVVLVLNVSTWLLATALRFRAAPGVPARAALHAADDLEVGLMSHMEATEAQGEEEDGFAAAAFCPPPLPRLNVLGVPTALRKRSPKSGGGPLPPLAEQGDCCLQQEPSSPAARLAAPVGNPEGEHSSSPAARLVAPVGNPKAEDLDDQCTVTTPPIAPSSTSSLDLSVNESVALVGYDGVAGELAEAAASLVRRHAQILKVPEDEAFLPGTTTHDSDGSGGITTARSSRLGRALRRLGLCETQMKCQDLSAMRHEDLAAERQRVRQELDSYEQELAIRFARPARSEEKEEMRVLYMYYWRVKEALANAEIETKAKDNYCITPEVSAEAYTLQPLPTLLPRHQAGRRLSDSSGRKKGCRVGRLREEDRENQIPQDLPGGRAEQPAMLTAQKATWAQPRVKPWR